MSAFENMIHLLDAAWYMRSQVVICLVGPPGIGKTAAVEQHAKAHGCGKVVKIVASRCVPSETVGMTMPNHKDRSMEIYNSMQLSSLEDGDILFLDELLEADQFVLSTLLTVIESREMADGTPLPDIQIVAATNDTIPPEQLKGNIRQRFMFQRFHMDKRGTAEYIYEKTGIEVPDTVLDKLTERGNDYNFLTPRSLTKLVLWIDNTPKEKLTEVAHIIDLMWNSMIGSDLEYARCKRDKKIKSPEQQVRDAIKETLKDISPDEFIEKFDDCSLGEMLELLQALPEWEDISKQLESLQIKGDEEDSSNDIVF